MIVSAIIGSPGYPAKTVQVELPLKGSQFSLFEVPVKTLSVIQLNIMSASSLFLYDVLTWA